MSEGLSGIEILECAKINFENLVKMNPGIARHPMYMIAMEQLENGIKLIENEDS